MSDAEILKIPAYNIESSNSSLMESIIASSKVKANDSIIFKNHKYHFSKIDSLIDSNNGIEYSLMIKKDSVTKLRNIYLVSLKGEQ